MLLSLVSGRSNKWPLICGRALCYDATSEAGWASRLCLLLYRVGTLLEPLRMVSLAPHSPGELTEDFLSTLHAAEDVPEVETRLPAKLIARTLIDIDSVDSLQHLPAPRSIHVLVVGE